MKIKSITVGGYKNLRKTSLLLDTITAIVSVNNYGKSNLLEAIDFGVQFMFANQKERNLMMSMVRSIPICRALENTPFEFQIEFDDPSLGEYRYVRYGFKFSWYKDDGSGRKIIDEKIEARSNTSVRYSSYLKRADGLYRRCKDTQSYRNIALEDTQLAIDILSAIDDIEIQPVINAIRKINFHICSSLDLSDRFQSAPLEYVDVKNESGILFDDNDVPRALFQLQQKDPEKYDIFVESAYSLFPEFTEISVQAYELKRQKSKVRMVIAQADANGTSVVEGDNSISIPNKIPFKIRDELYKLLITSKYLNQPIDMSMMSTGTKRVFWLLTNAFIASLRRMSFIGVEELETSIHPKLMKTLLEVLDEVLEDTPIIISSHSPFLIQYIKPSQIYIGAPNNDGTAQFKRIQPQKIKNVISVARDMDMSVGEYLFDLMSGDIDSSDRLSLYLEA